MPDESKRTVYKITLEFLPGIRIEDVVKEMWSIHQKNKFCDVETVFNQSKISIVSEEKP